MLGGPDIHLYNQFLFFQSPPKLVEPRIGETISVRSQIDVLNGKPIAMLS